MRKTPLLSKYLDAFEKDPQSKVFAPLAESYRRLGMLDDAKKVLKQGLYYHPKYIPGLLTLAHCHYDEKNYFEAYKILTPLKKDQYENYSLQKLLAKVCFRTGNTDEALSTYKYLLFINPKDDDAAKMVEELESELSPKDIIQDTGFTKESLDNIDEDSWIQVDFSKPSDDIKLTETKIESHVEAEPEDQEVLEERRPSKIEENYYEDESPVMTHTLVDLYFNQKLYGKALDVLERIIELQPNDEKSKQRYDEIKKLIVSGEKTNSGHDELMNIYDQKFSTSTSAEIDELKQVEEKYNQFLSGIMERARVYRENSNN